MLLLPIGNVNDWPLPVLNDFCNVPTTYLALVALDIAPLVPNETLFAPVVIFPIPGVEGAIAKAILNAENQAERVQTTVGNVETEFIYEKYDDYNSPDDKVFGYFPGHIVEKRNGTTILDLTITQTDVGNLYVVVPVPPNVRAAR